MATKKDTLLCSTIKLMRENGIPPSKIAIQKFIYFLLKKGLPLPYDFKMYIYGPYSSQLNFDLQVLEFSNTIEYQDQEYNIIEEINVPKKYFNAINDNILIFKEILPQIDFKSFELYGTVFYIMNALKRFSIELTFENIYKEFVGYKGQKYTQPEVQEAFQKIYGSNQDLFDSVQ